MKINQITPIRYGQSEINKPETDFLPEEEIVIPTKQSQSSTAKILLGAGILATTAAAGITIAKNKKIKNSEDMTATANFRQVAQYIGLAICGLMMRTAFGVFGILWGIIREIVNGVFRVAIGVIVAILSTIAFFGFILWLFTL